MKIYLAQKHDRHTDDNFVAFYSMRGAQRQCREWVSHYPDRYTFKVENPMGFGKWCLYCAEDYYMAVHEIQLIKFE